MKKRLFRNLLILGLLLVALTVMASAIESDYYVNSPDDRQIKLTIDGTYHCIWEEDRGVPHTPQSQYTWIVKVNSWTQNGISLSVSIGTIQCKIPDGRIMYHHAANPDRTVTFSGTDLCHKKLDLTGSLIYISFYDVKEYDWIDYTLTYDKPYYQPIEHPKAEPTCTAYGYSETCYECPECGAFFSDAAAENKIDVSSVRIEKLPHTYGTDGSCKNCSYKAEAYIETSGTRTYYDTAETAAAASASDKIAHVFHFAREGEAEDKTITLATNAWLSVDTGIEIPELRLADSANVTVSIRNSGRIGTISPASTGQQSLTIVNQSGGSIGTIKVAANAQLSMDIQNNAGAVIDMISRQSTASVDGMSVTVRNNGTVGWVLGIKPIKLQSGTGTYGGINTEYTDSKARDLLADDCKFYLTESQAWVGTESTFVLHRNFIVSAPPFSVKVAGNGLTQEENGYSLTMKNDDAKDQNLTASVSCEGLTGLSSAGAHFTYAWYYTGDSKPAWETETLLLSNLAVGTNNLTLCVTDDKYGYTQSVNVTVTITAEGLVPISLKTPTGTVTKMYDGTAAIPSDLSITFVDSNGNTVQLTKDTDYEIVTAEYNSPNCSEAKQVTVRVKLKGDAASKYSLTVSHFTVPGTITKFKPDSRYPFFLGFYEGILYANVGDPIIDKLLEKFTIKINYGYRDLNLPNPMDADPKPKLTFYHMRSSGVVDPTTDEMLTKDSVFTYASASHNDYYFFYAVVEETENYEELFVYYSGAVVKVLSGETHEHRPCGRADCTEHEPLTYDAFTGSSLTVKGESLKKYLNANRPTVNLDLLLSKPEFDRASGEYKKASLSLCLFGKTLRADSSYTKQFRVTNESYLALSDCVGTGTLMGTSVTDEYGGCLYVADATAELYNIKVTGGSSSKLGGAIVVDKNGTLNIYGGEISDNTVTSGNGGAIYIKSGGVVNMYGGKIQNNHAYSGNGGAIYVEAGGTLNLYGGTITGNTASTLGGGIYVEKGGTLKIQGNPVVTGNTAGGKDSNVYVCVDSTNPLLTISGELTDGAKLGVSTNAPYPILLAASEQDYSAYFTPDDPDAFVLFSGSALTLCAKPSATLNGTELTVKTGGKYASDACILFVAEYGKDDRMLAVQSKTIEPGTAAYTFTVKNSGAKLKCFLLRKDTYTPLFEAFTPQ